MDKELNLNQIKELIPHREPFLYLDSLVDIIKLKKATGIKIFTEDEDFFKGHFPRNPVVPGVILVEMMAQTAAALIAYSLRSETFDKIVYLMNVESSKFRNPVFPEMKVKADVESLRSRGRVWKFYGRMYDEKSNLVCESIWSAMIMDKKDV
tara:strand:+ start:364 stop:819 length:456 start_codon:yes stop_codon:yes gene_type:complete